LACLIKSSRIFLKLTNQGVTTKLIVNLGSHLPKRQFCVNERGKECLKEIFEPNKSDIQAFDRLYLEDFVNASNFEVQNQLERLNLSVSIAFSLVYTHEEFYELASQNLKKIAPNLKTIGLYGTLRIYPNISVT
jgi:hypothetical protein